MLARAGRCWSCVDDPPPPELSPEERKREEERKRKEEDDSLATSRHFGFGGEWRTISQIKKDSIAKGKEELPPDRSLQACSRLKKLYTDVNIPKIDPDTRAYFVDGIHIVPTEDPWQDVLKCYVFKKDSQGGGKYSSSRKKKKSHKRKKTKMKSKRKNKSKRTKKRKKR